MNMISICNLALGFQKKTFINSYLHSKLFKSLFSVEFSHIPKMMSKYPYLYLNGSKNSIYCSIWVYMHMNMFSICNLAWGFQKKTFVNSYFHSKLFKSSFSVEFSYITKTLSEYSYLYLNASKNSIYCWL